MTTLAASPEQSPHRVVIEPNQNWVRFDYKALWAARDLLYLFVHRDFASKYKQTILGPAWFVVQPILTTGVFMIIQMLGNLGSRDVPLPLYNLSGLLAWQYFAGIITNTGTTFVTHANLLRKVYFPRLTIPISTAISQLMTVAVQGLFFAVVLCGYLLFTDSGNSVTFNWWAIALLPLVLVHIAIMALGIAFITSWLTARYRDMTFLIPFFVQLALYMTPVIYSLDQVRDRLPDQWSWVVFLNPMAPVVEFFRFALLGSGGVHPNAFLWSIAFTLGLFFGGMMLFQRTERTFVDSV